MLAKNRLTAFILKSFAEASTFVYVDRDPLEQSVVWLLEQQRRDGAFPPLGRLLNDKLQVLYWVYSPSHPLFQSTSTFTRVVTVSRYNIMCGRQIGGWNRLRRGVELRPFLLISSWRPDVVGRSRRSRVADRPRGDRLAWTRRCRDGIVMRYILKASASPADLLVS